MVVKHAARMFVHSGPSWRVKKPGAALAALGLELPGLELPAYPHTPQQRT